MKNLKMYDVVKKPLMTEKSSILADADKQTYLFEVALKSDKKAIKEAIENIFDVKVDSINTVIMRGKIKRVGRIFGKKSNRKKAYVTLKDGYSINLVEGV